MSLKIKLFFIFSLFILFGCKKEKEENIYISNFEIEGFDVEISGTSIIGKTTQRVDVSSLTAAFSATGEVRVDGILQESGITKNDFSSPLKYTVYSQKTGKTKDYIVKLITYTGLPILYITTEGRQSVTSKDDYVNASFIFNPNGYGFYEVIKRTGEIRGRGNSTWGMAPKKAYKIKFDRAAEVFGTVPYKEWVLLANYIDKTLIRTWLAFEMGRRLEMEYVPSHHFMEVFFNGKHLGNYLLTDQIDEIGETRLNINGLFPSDSDTETVSEGYLLEFDARGQEKDSPYFFSQGNLIAVEYPNNPTTKQINYIKNYVINADKVLFSSIYQDAEHGFRKYFDEESMIKWFFVNELFKNVDAVSFSSIYFYKKKNDSKLYMGPLWDFDLGAANARHCVGCQNYAGWYIKNHYRFNRMYQDPAFKQKVAEMWMKYKHELKKTIDEIDSLTAFLDNSQQKNYMLWTNFSDPDYFVMPGNLSYLSQVTYMKTFLKKRYDWLDKQLTK